MKILQTETYLRKHSKSNDNIEGNIITTNKMSMGLVNNSELQFIKVDDNLYFTNVDTDFMLDIYLEVLIRFDSEGKVVTVMDLYELYCKVKGYEEEAINNSNELGETWRLLHYNSQIAKEPFEKMEEELKGVLKRSVVQNN